MRINCTHYPAIEKIRWHGRASRELRKMLIELFWKQVLEEMSLHGRPAEACFSKAARMNARRALCVMVYNATSIKDLIEKIEKLQP